MLHIRIGTKLVAASLAIITLSVNGGLTGCSGTDEDVEEPTPVSQGRLPHTAPAVVRTPDAQTAVNSGYAMLASQLADPFLTETNPPRLRKELAQLFAETKIKVLRYQSIEASDPLVKHAAQEAANAGIEMIQSRETLEWLTGDDGFSDFMLTALGLYLGDSGATLNHAGRFLNKGDARQAERIRWAKAFNRSRTAQLMLPETAKAYAGPASSSGKLVSIDLDESFAASADHDRATMINTSGTRLTHCTVLVELRGRDGDVRQNIHYVDTWEPGTPKLARYSIGVDADSGIYGRRTVYGIQEARVSVWSDQARQEEMVYRYAGLERDKDIRAALEGRMKVMYRYERTSGFGGPPRVMLVLKDVPEIPDHTVTLVLHPKAGAKSVQPVSLNWNQKVWKGDEERLFSLGSYVNFVPERIEIRVGFSGVAYTYSRDVTIVTQ